MFPRMSDSSAPPLAQDRRQAPRYDYDCPVLIAHEAEGFVAHIENVSVTGCCTTRPLDWSLSLGAVVRLFLMVDMRHVHSVLARVMWCSEHFVGFQYAEQQPLPR